MELLDAADQQSHEMLCRLQEVYAKNELYQLLVFIMGQPESGNDYYDDVEDLVQLYRSKRFAYEKSQDQPAEGGALPAGQTQEEFMLRILSDAINGGDVEDAIPDSQLRLLYNTLEAVYPSDSQLEAAVDIGAVCLANEEEKRQRAELANKAAEAASSTAAHEFSTTSSAERRTAMKVSPEELFRMAQRVRSGLTDESELLEAEVEDDVDEAVELNEDEPKFLRRLGLSSSRNRINYRRLLPSQMLQEARTPQARQAILDRMAAADKPSATANSMEMTAHAQAKINTQRRIISKRQKQQQQRMEEEAAGDAGESAGGLIHSELCEPAAGDAVSPRHIPPWARQKGKMSFGLPQNTDSLAEQRRRLPIYKKRDELLEFVANHRVTIVVAETGSGKTTQIPQYLSEAGYSKHGIIACTQPRRVAAETLAMRVAEEHGCRLGEEVGFTVRFRDVTSPLTIIKYMTDGMLLREALLDDSFRRYSVIILDEAHERSINTDLLFFIVRAAIQKNPALKVLITSATLEATKFCEYFGVPAAFIIEGRAFPVETYYLSTPTTDYVRSSLQTVMRLHLEEPPGDILVFFTGQEEIELGGEQLTTWMTALQRESTVPIPSMLVLPLTATMPQDVQSKVFEPTPPGCRKVVLATNVAETSITIPNLFYVVDSGFCKQNVFNAKSGMEQLMVVPVSRAQAMQRSGRAGRIGPGKCYRMYTEEQYTKDLLAETVPDIMRANLFSVTLQLKAMGIDLASVDLMDPPDMDSVTAALEKLRYLEALDDDGFLTPLGGRMAELSIDPSQSKTLLTAVDMGCSTPVLTIVSMLAVQKRGVFYRPRSQQDAADEAKRSFDQPEGDQISLMAVYNAWEENDMSEEWCKRNFLKYRMLVEARDTRDQLLEMLKRRYRNLSHENDNNLTAVRKALCSGYFFNAARRLDSHTRSYVTLADRREVYVHPSSSLTDQPPKYVLYDDLRVTNREYMTELLVIEPQWLVELAPAFYSRPKGRRTKAQEAERFIPLLKAWETGSSWRISKLKRQRK